MTTTVVKEEELEGLDSTSGGDTLESYPIDSVLIRTENRTVYEIVRRMRNKQYILDPEFQRDFVWDEKKQSRLIESMLMRIPLPVFYLAENDNGEVIVVDGLQRLTTFYRYLDNELTLRGLESTSLQLEGKKFADLSPKLQNRLEDTQLILYLIDAKAPERAKLDIFERVNGGEPLTRQQMRNSLYMGQATQWLKVQAKNPAFFTATAGSINAKTMRDREVINRFCGFHLLGLETYKGDMDNFLAATLRHMNGMANLTALSEAFQTSMTNNHNVFGQHAFRKHKPGVIWRNIINVALFDVFSVILARYPIEWVQTHAETIHQIFFELTTNKIFNDAITNSTNSLRKVQTRFELAEAAFKEL